MFKVEEVKKSFKNKEVLKQVESILKIPENTLKD